MQGRVDVASTNAPAAAGATTATTNGKGAPASPGTVATALPAVGVALAGGAAGAGRRIGDPRDGKSSSGTGTPRVRRPPRPGPTTTSQPRSIRRHPATSSSTEGNGVAPTITTGPTATAASAPTSAAAANAVAGAGGAQGSAQTAAVDSTDEASTTARSAPVAEQVLDAVLPMRDHADGDYNVKLELHPADLGRVELTVELHDGVLSVHMQADSAATRDVLQHQLAKLRDMLQERGVRTGSLDVGDQRDRTAPQDRQADERDASSSRTSHAESESASAPVAVQSTSNTTSRSASGRLDLHV